jgi:predicted DNA-binding ribbon-helix-helix protein
MSREGRRHLRKRSFALAGHRTSVALEPEFWAVLEAAAQGRGVSLAALVAQVDAGRAEATTVPLASALRVFALGEVSRPAPTPALPRQAGEGGDRPPTLPSTPAAFR